MRSARLRLSPGVSPIIAVAAAIIVQFRALA
jgi:hypothetical protein